MGTTTDRRLAEGGSSPAPTEVEGAPAAPDAREAAVRAPRLGERYILSSKLGEGGMGEVFLARDAKLDREVALKVVSSDDEGAQALFVREARLTAQLEHPNVLPIHDLVSDDRGRLCFAMKLVRGHSTLADVIARLKAGDRSMHSFTYQRRVVLVQEVCRALAHAHERGVVHRDVKPSNVVVGPHGEVYLLDWGIAERLDEVRRLDELAGTPAYMAPEQFGGQPPDRRSDIYSVAALLYELLTLEHPLGAVGHAKLPVIAAAHASAAPIPPAESFVNPLHGRVPRALSRVCERGLERDPARRLASIEALDLALQRWLEGTAPIVCAGTCFQRVLSRWSYLIDQRPFLVPLISILLAILFVRWLVDLAGELVRLVSSL